MGSLESLELRYAMPPTWEGSLARLQGQCRVCGKGFAEGDSYVSAVNVTETAIERHDACDACAEEFKKKAFAHWHGKITRVDGRRRKQLDLGFLLDFFKRLRAAGDDEKHRDITYIIALVLMRKKILSQVRGERDPEHLIVRFTGDPDSPIQKLKIPELTPDRMAAIKDDLTRIFNLEEGQDADRTQAAPIETAPQAEGREPNAS